jgi:hypothetical protein
MYRYIYSVSPYAVLNTETQTCLIVIKSEDFAAKTQVYDRIIELCVSLSSLTTKYKDIKV